MDNYNEKFRVDFNLGTKNEIDLLSVFRTFFNDDTLIRSIDRFSNFDFTNNNNLLIELKTRNNKYDQYEDTLINIIKINKSKKLCKTHNIYFCFSFTDGIYYWKYDIENKLNYRVGGRSDRTGKINEKKLYAHIPIVLLTKINI